MEHFRMKSSNETENEVNTFPLKIESTDEEREKKNVEKLRDKKF